MEIMIRADGNFFLFPLYFHRTAFGYIHCKEINYYGKMMSKIEIQQTVNRAYNMKNECQV